MRAANALPVSGEALWFVGETDVRPAREIVLPLVGEVPVRDNISVEVPAPVEVPLREKFPAVIVRSAVAAGWLPCPLRPPPVPPVLSVPPVPPV